MLALQQVHIKVLGHIHNTKSKTASEVTPGHSVWWCIFNREQHVRRNVSAEIVPSQGSLSGLCSYCQCEYNKVLLFGAQIMLMMGKAGGKFMLMKLPHIRHINRERRGDARGNDGMPEKQKMKSTRYIRHKNPPGQIA